MRKEPKYMSGIRHLQTEIQRFNHLAAYTNRIAQYPSPIAIQFDKVFSVFSAIAPFCQHMHLVQDGPDKFAPIKAIVFQYKLTSQQSRIDCQLFENE